MNSAAFLVLLAAIVVAFSQGAVALATPVNTWIFSGDTVTVEDQSFTIYLSSKTNEIIADYGKSSLFIKNNSCEATEIARICLDNIQYDEASRSYKVKVRGVSLAPIVAITREVTKSEFIVGEEVTFSVTLKNTGGIARNVTYEEVLPAGFSVTAVEGILRQADRAVWKGKIDTGKSVTFSYTVKANNTFDVALISSVTYWDGIRLKTVYSGKLALKATPSMILNTILADSAIIPGERDNVTVNITSKVPESALVNVEVVFDPGLRVVSRPYEANAISPFVYTWSGSIDKTNKSVNLSKALFFEFKGGNVGNSNIQAKVSYKAASESSFRTLPESKQSVLVSNRGVIVRSSLKDSSIESGQRKGIRIWLQNLNPYAKIERVQVNTSTGLLYLPNSYIGQMAAGEQSLLIDKGFYAPHVDKSTGYVLSTKVSYFTEFGDNFTESFKDTATVAPPQEVSASQVVSSTAAKGGDELEVSVTVKNPRLANLRNVQVSDNVSSGFTVLGKNSAILEVKSKESVKAYSYKIGVPHVARETIMHVNTTMRYSESFSSIAYENPQEFVASTSTSIAVQPETLPLALSRTIGDSAIYAGEVFDVKYAVTNNAKDRTAMGIKLRIPLSRELDLVNGAETFEIPELDPGESFAIADSEKRRAKFAGQFELPPATLTYENSYGGHYEVNGTKSAISVADNYISGPVILVNKIAPKSANNTDDFQVSLKVENIGTEAAVVAIDDKGRKFSINVANGTAYYINSTSRYPAAGLVALPKAMVSYEHNGVLYRTSSDEPVVDIADNPVLKLVKDAPANSSNTQPFTVLITAWNTAQKSVENITVADGGRSWHIESIPGKGHANLSYERLSSFLGVQSLGAAEASYIYGGLAYNVASNSPSVSVSERKLLSASKWVVPQNATPGEKVTVILGVASFHDADIDVAVSDDVKSFTATLKAGEAKNFTYQEGAGDKIAAPATVRYEFNGQAFVESSKKPELNLTGMGPAEPVEAAEKKGNIFSSFMKSLRNLLTWKRGG